MKDRSAPGINPAPRTKHEGGRPSGQFAYNRQELLGYLRQFPTTCELTNEELAKRMVMAVAGSGTSLSKRQVGRWLASLIDRGEIQAIYVKYRVNRDGWISTRRIKVISKEIE